MTAVLAFWHKLHNKVWRCFVLFWGFRAVFYGGEKRHRMPSRSHFITSTASCISFVSTYLLNRIHGKRKVWVLRQRKRGERHSPSSTPPFFSPRPFNVSASTLYFSLWLPNREGKPVSLTITLVSKQRKEAGCFHFTMLCWKCAVLLQLRIQFLGEKSCCNLSFLLVFSGMRGCDL